ncbi:hypothetical protein Tco_1036212, partial [Tanacetum coccineum]
MAGAWHHYRTRKSEPQLLLAHPNYCLKQRLYFFRAYFIDIRSVARQPYCIAILAMAFVCYDLQTPVFWRGSHSHTVVAALDSVLSGSYTSGTEPQNSGGECGPPAETMSLQRTKLTPAKYKGIMRRITKGKGNTRRPLQPTTKSGLLDIARTEVAPAILYLTKAKARDQICKVIQYGSKFLTNGEAGTTQNVDKASSLASRVFCLFK